MFMLRFRYPAAIAVLLLLGVCLPGWAGTIYSGSNNSQLVAIDTVTGHGTPADQPFGVGGVFAGAFSPNGTFYIVTGMNSNNSQLATVDLLTGHANPYAHLAINSIDMLQFSPSGILYASDGSTLFQMNVTTGALTTIGNFFPGNPAGNPALQCGYGLHHGAGVRRWRQPLCHEFLPSKLAALPGRSGCALA